MQDIILDCDLMRHPNSGLYYYCLNLANSVSDQLEGAKMNMKYYAPMAEAESFARPEKVVVEKKMHKLIRPFLWNCRVWHAPFQSGRIIPDRRLSLYTKVLLTVHDLNPLHEDKTEEERRRSIAHTQSLIDRSDALVCISEFSRKDVLQHCDVGNKPVHVIHNGNNSLAAPALTRLSYQPARPFLFGIGYVNRKKNYHVLLSLLKEQEDLELVVAGRQDEPDYIERLLQQANDWGIADRVKLTGPVTDEEKSWYLQNCHAFMHPSLAEGFGLPVIEAMVCGKPVFISNLTSLPEIGGDAAFYFNSFSGDHMTDVFQKGMQDYHSNGMAEKIRQRGAHFNWEKSAAQYIEVYKSLY